MAHSLARALALINRIVDWFIPADIAASREMSRQARMFLISHLLGPFIGNVVPAALFVLDPEPGFQIAVLAVAITAFWIYPFVLRAFGHYNVLAIISIQNLIFCILWSCYWYGGVTSPTLPWVLTIPLLAFFYLGSAPALRLAALSLFALNFLVFFYFSSDETAGRNNVPTDALQALGIVSTVAASLYVTMMALFYAKALASHNDLASEMRGHLETADELRRATEEADRASAAKADFLAKMSHELRTPLNAVIGYSQILLEDAADEGDKESASDLQKIHGAGHHLLKLVNEILDLSKIEAGKMDLYNEPVELAAMLDELVTEFREAASRNSNRLSLEFDGALGEIVCDAMKFRQAAWQIIDNAIKFTRGGEVKVHAMRVRSGGAESVEISVSDTGIGIPAHQLPTLFEKFTVIDDSSASKYGGTGLGLALSQKLCKLMGGEITVASTPGRGSRFTIRMPTAPPAAEASAGADLDALARRGVESAAQKIGQWGASLAGGGPRAAVAGDA